MKHYVVLGRKTNITFKGNCMKMLAAAAAAAWGTEKYTSD